jgi:prepilin-type N-terminal cleavage/methylation domain-containing protein
VSRAALPPGFTLIELVVVITLLAILAWIAWPSLASMGEIRLDAAARRVTADLRYAQNRAIGSRVTHGVRFDVGAGRYIVYAGNSGAALVNPGDRGKTLTITFGALMETRGVTIASAAFGATPAVTYDSYGVPRDSTGVELVSTGRVVLAYQGLMDTVEVAPQTGAVRVR